MMSFFLNGTHHHQAVQKDEPIQASRFILVLNFKIKSCVDKIVVFSPSLETTREEGLFSDKTGPDYRDESFKCG